MERAELLSDLKSSTKSSDTVSAATAPPPPARLNSPVQATRTDGGGNAAPAANPSQTSGTLTPTSSATTLVLKFKSLGAGNDAAAACTATTVSSTPQVRSPGAPSPPQKQGSRGAKRKTAADVNTTRSDEIFTTYRKRSPPPPPEKNCGYCGIAEHVTSQDGCKRKGETELKLKNVATASEAATKNSEDIKEGSILDFHSKLMTDVTVRLNQMDLVAELGHLGLPIPKAKISNPIDEEGFDTLEEIQADKMNKDDDEGEKELCYCRNTDYFGDWIGCDGRNCHVGWFHSPCVGITGNPPPLDEPWFCSSCSNKKNSTKNQRKKNASKN